MNRREQRTDELTRSGAVERNELARAAGEIGRRVRATTDRFGPALRIAGGAVAALGVGGAIVLVARRIRARGRSAGRLARLRESALEVRRRALRRRSLPLTLLLLLARSPYARRAVAGAIESARNRSSRGAERDRDEEPDEAAPRCETGGEKRREPRESRGSAAAPVPEESPPARIPRPPVPRAEAKEAPLPEKLGIGLELVKAAYGRFDRDEGFARAAALAYYTLFSLAPLLVIAVAVAGFVFGRDAAQGRVLDQIKGMVGPDAARTLQTLMAKSQKPAANIVATLLGVATLLFGAAGVFGNLQQSLNRIWGVPENPHGGFWKMIQNRYLSLAMVFGTGFLLLVSLLVSVALSAVGEVIRRDLSGGVGFALNGAYAVFSWAIVGVIFALIFKYLPDARIAWRDVWIGAAVTSLLFAIGQFAIGLYIGKTSVSSVYGGAASLAIILIWTYYSAAIFYFGAEVTKVFATWYGSKRK